MHQLPELTDISLPTAGRLQVPQAILPKPSTTARPMAHLCASDHAAVARSSFQSDKLDSSGQVIVHPCTPTNPEEISHLILRRIFSSFSGMNIHATQKANQQSLLQDVNFVIYTEKGAAFVGEARLLGNVLKVPKGFGRPFAATRTTALPTPRRSFMGTRIKSPRSMASGSFYGTGQDEPHR